MNVICVVCNSMMDPLEGDDSVLSVENQYSDGSIDDTCLNSSDDSSEEFLYNDEDNCLCDDNNSLISDDHLNQSDSSDAVYFSDDSENDSNHQEATFNDHQEATFGDSNSVHEPADLDHSINVSLLSIMDKHSLSYACIEDILQLVSASVPNFTSSSLHVLLKQYTEPKESIRMHRCCGNCSKLLHPGTSCTMPECVVGGMPASTFIEVQLDYQLKLLFTGKL